MAKGQYRLVMRQGPVPGQIFELAKDEVSIGRDIANDFVINDAEVSRRHAKLTLEADRYKIEDLNSTNGTYIDGQRLIGPHLMAIGEIIMFGDNVGVIFDGEPVEPGMEVTRQSDLGATPVSAIPTPAESYAQPQTVLPSQMTNIPAPVEEVAGIEPGAEEEPAKKPANSWLMAGCGCAIVVLLLLIALFVFIDQPWNPGGGLYCKTPFDIIFRAVGFCP